MKRNSGSILITTLWIMAILGLLAMGTGFHASLEARLARYSLDRLEARYLANAGVVKAVYFLTKDDNDYDTLYECGIKLKTGESAEGIFGEQPVELSGKESGRSFSVRYTRKEGGEEKTYYGMEDEQAKININMLQLSPDNLDEYRRILSQLSGELNTYIINAMIIWQDKDQAASLPPLPESEFLTSSKDGNFDCIEELMLVKGMTPEIFDKIKDNITVHGNGKINANTASVEVLKAVIDDDSTVDKIVNCRKNKAISKFSDILDLSSTELGLLTSSPVIVKSDYFRITSYGKVLNRMTKTISCVVMRNGKEKPKLLEYREE